MSQIQFPLNKYDVYPKDKLWYAVEFNFNNPTSSPSTIDLFNGYNQTPTPISTPLYDTPVKLNATVNTSIVANQRGAYCISNNCLYVTNDGGSFNRIDVINCATNLIVRTFSALEISNTPIAIVYNPVNNQMYVSSNSTVVRIDCSNNTVFGTSIAASGDNMAYDSFNNTIYIGANTSVVIIDCGTNLIIGSPILFPSGYVFTGTGNCLCYNASMNRIYACLTDSINPITFVIDCLSNAIIDTINITGAAMMLYNPNNNSLYAANFDLEVYVIDCYTDSVIKTFTFPASDYQYGLALNIFNNTVYGFSNLYGGYYYIDCDDNSIHSIIPNIGVDFPSFGFYNTINNSMYITNYSSNSVYVLRNTPNVYITGSGNYNEFVTELQNTPKRVRHIRLTVESYSQMAIPMYLLTRDANGNSCGDPKIPTEYLNTNDYQSFICELPFKPKELILNNNTIISQYTIAASSTVSMVIYYDQIDMSDMMSDKIEVCKIIETKCPDLNSLTEQQLENTQEFRPTVKPSWLKNFASARKI